MNTAFLYHLLVIDDDRRLRGLLEKFLSDQDFMVSAAANAAEGRQILMTEDIELIVLDVMMPEESGIVFLEKLRQNPSSVLQKIPVLMLTALDDPQQRIEGLEKGADDYLTKPFEPKELLLRIQRILERTARDKIKSTIVKIGHLHFDLNRKMLMNQQQMIPLSSAEQQLLEYFIHHPRQEISREQLAVHAGVLLSLRTIDVQITRLRRRIEEDPKQPRYLRTIRHRGYAFFPDD